MQSHTATKCCQRSRCLYKVQASILMIRWSADGTESESLLTNSSAMFVLTEHQPDVCRQLLATVSFPTGTDWLKQDPHAVHSTFVALINASSTNSNTSVSYRWHFTHHTAKCPNVNVHLFRNQCWILWFKLLILSEDKCVVQWQNRSHSCVDFCLKSLQNLVLASFWISVRSLLSIWANLVLQVSRTIHTDNVQITEKYISWTHCSFRLTGAGAYSNMLWETPRLTASLNSRQRQTISTHFGNEAQSNSSAFLWIMWRKHLGGNLSGSGSYCPSCGSHLQWKWRENRETREEETRGGEADLF